MEKTYTNGWYDLAGNGGYAITRDLNKNEIKKLLKQKDLNAIVPKTSSKPLCQRTWKLLDKFIFSNKPNVSLNISSWSNVNEDLTFLQYVPSLLNFSFNLPNLKSFEDLKYLNPNLYSLSISDTTSTKPDLSILGSFLELKDLTLGTGNTKGIENISKLKKLVSLRLAGTKFKDYNLLKELIDLRYLVIVFGGTTDISALQYLNIKYLEMWQVRKLEDISVISNMPTLEEIQIGGMRNVKEIPDLSELKLLKKIYFEKMDGVYDLKPLLTAKKLEHFKFVNAPHLEPDDIVYLKKSRSLKKINIGFGSDKKNKKFKELFS